MPTLTEDDIVAAITATMVGAINSDLEKEDAVARYLLTLLPRAVLEREEVAASTVRTVARMVLEDLPTPEGVVAPLEEEGADLAFSDGPLGLGGYAREILSRARYAASAVKRLASNFLSGKGGEGVNKERAHYEAHRRAGVQREEKARLLDEAHANYGDLMGWYSVLDSSTTPECRNANGKNFRISHPPSIGLPGLGPHPNCRCHAGPPFPNGDLL
jgi:hypothetical protein